jgi:NAD(P)-dependent dehydrogenase (short-subunit alcohol dehydrogenase family)
MTKTQQTSIALGALAIGGALISRGLRVSRRMEFRGRSIVITGGSRGLGLLIARQLGEEGARLTLVARDQAELERARADIEGRGAQAAIFVGDVGVRGDAERLMTEVIDRWGTVDVLINNAGVIQVGPVEHMEPADFAEAMAVHFWGPLHTMLAVIPAMRRQGGGRIVNISSIGGKIGVPHLVPYCASKFALTGLSEAMRTELARESIYVTTVCPGLMRTGSPFNAWFKGRNREEFTWFTIASSLPLLTIDAHRAAAQIVDAGRYGDAELVVTWPAKLAVIAQALCPEAVATALDAANRLLPCAIEGGERPHSGWQSLSDWAPSRLTTLTERAAAANNELPE